MSKPLALLSFSNTLLGNQLSGRLQDMGYRVLTLPDLAALQEWCEREKPLLVIAEVANAGANFAGIYLMRNTPATSHIPVLAFSASQDKALQTLAEKSGVSLLAGNAAILEHLPRLLDQVLQI